MSVFWGLIAAAVFGVVFAVIFYLLSEVFRP